MNEELKENINKKLVLEKLMGLKDNQFLRPDDLNPGVLKEEAMETMTGCHITNYHRFSSIPTELVTTLGACEIIVRLGRLIEG